MKLFRIPFVVLVTIGLAITGVALYCLCCKNTNSNNFKIKKFGVKKF
jgi:phage shock protein PspC (stress-responsive transcriptional regulator)